MLTNCVHQKQLQFRTVLMDTWYATKKAMLSIEQLGKIYYCPLKDNRQVDDSKAVAPYRRVDSLAWWAAESHCLCHPGLGPAQTGCLGNWTIHLYHENRVHYPRDVSMDEDACQVHTGNAPQALAALRNAILSLLHHEGWHYLPDAFRFFAANPQKALQTLGAFST